MRYRQFPASGEILVCIQAQIYTLSIICPENVHAINDTCNDGERSRQEAKWWSVCNGRQQVIHSLLEA